MAHTGLLVFGVQLPAPASHRTLVPVPRRPRALAVRVPAGTTLGVAEGRVLLDRFGASDFSRNRVASCASGAGCWKGRVRISGGYGGGLAVAVAVVIVVAAAAVVIAAAGMPRCCGGCAVVQRKGVVS